MQNLGEKRLTAKGYFVISSLLFGLFLELKI